MMKATGIVRRANKDGLIPISKAIRDRLNIGEDCYLEFFIDKREGTIMLKKYEPVSKKTYEQTSLRSFRMHRKIMTEPYVLVLSMRTEWNVRERQMN